ncbi:MAG: endonuclease/exonuclease/phosphatase family protein [Myxococcota bacterium]
MPRTLVSWNVNGLDDHRLDERTEAACLALLLPASLTAPQPPPDAILLQELVVRSWHAHWKHHLHHAGYAVFPPDPPASTDSEYFCALAIRGDHPVTAHGVEPFPNSDMGRALVWARAGGWWIATSHLESGAAASDVRRAQLATVAARLLAEPGPAIFAGDTNLRRDEAEGVPGADQLVDAWVAAGPPTREDARHLELPGSRTPGARFDRALHNAARARWRSVDGPRRGPRRGAASDHRSPCGSPLDAPP